MTGYDQRLINTFNKNFGIDSDGDLELRNLGLKLLDGELQVPTFYENAPWDADRVVLFDHFAGYDICAKWGSLTNGTGATRAASGSDHSVVLTTGTADNGYAAIHSGLHWAGEDNVEFTTEVIIGATITTTKLEVGLTDAVDDAGAWTNDSLLEDGTGATATDCVIFIWDTDKHANELYVAGVIDDTGWGGVDTGVVIEASATYKFRITLVGTTAYFYYKKVGTHTTWQLLYTKTDAITANIKLASWVFAQALGAAASRAVNVHFKHLIQDE